MVELYGKDIQMRKLRSLEGEKILNDRAKTAADAYFSHCGSKHGSKCRICDSEDTSLYFEAYGGYLYYECHNCGSLFLDNLPDLEKMYRTDDLSNTKALIDDTIFQERVKQFQTPKVDFVLDVCKQNNISSTNWVDVGAGGGQLLVAVQSRNIKAYGVESDKSEIDFMRSKGISVLEAFVDPYATNEPLEELLGGADVVSFMMVLEHVKSPAAVVDYFYNKMLSMDA